ncbi:MAG TPA: hypothetical protein VE863_06260 [Pyrinomonadaceae bacterium]|jgi:hypothetical protein|nr:hypothetical protein [Pyrinomonadaceae bacterium]
MSSKTPESTLKDYLLDGVAKEIFFAEEAKFVALEIGRHADEVNARGFGRLFGSMQVAYSDRQTLCITKIFDPEDRKYPTRSIPAILNLIERNASSWSLPQRHKLEEILVGTPYDSAFGKVNDSELAVYVAAHFRDLFPGTGTLSAPQLSRAIVALREARNKVIAHNEAIDHRARTLPTWAEADALVEYAKGFVTVISFGFLSLFMGNDSRTYLRTPDSSGAAFGLKKLFTDANL